LFCELKKIFSDHTVSYDKVIKLENKNNTEQKIEVDIFIENFFSKSVHLFIENDGYLWQKDKRDKYTFIYYKDINKFNDIINYNKT
jgi:hypothetical protein